MKKEEVLEIMWHLFDNVDHAPYDMEIKQLINTAPANEHKKIIESMLINNEWEYQPDEEILNKAKKLCRVSPE